MERCFGGPGSTTPWGGQRWWQRGVFDKRFRASSGCDTRGFTPEQAKAVHGQRYTTADLRRLGFC